MPTLAKLYEEHSRPSAWQSEVALPRVQRTIIYWIGGLLGLLVLSGWVASAPQEVPSTGGVASGARTSKLV